MSLRKIKKGIFSASKIIGLTAGANGKLVVVNTGVDTLTTKDGVSVAKYFIEDDVDKMAGVKLVRQVCKAQLSEHGDGTTAAAVMFGSLVKQFITKRQMAKIDKELADLTPDKIESSGNLAHAALTSANYISEIAEPIKDAVLQNGPNGLYMCEQAPVKGIVVENVNGFFFSGGYADPWCVNTSNGTCVFNNPLVWTKAEYNLQDLQPIANRAISEGRPLVIVGQPDEQTRESLKSNHLRGILLSAAVIPEKLGHSLDVLITDLQKLFDGAEYGIVDKIVISPKKTIITHSKDLTKYAESVKNAEAGSEAERNENEMRSSRLLSKVCLIKVGALTASSLRQFSDQVDDCLRSTISAAKYGTCAGGGLALLNAVKNPKLKKAVKAYMTAIGDKTGKKILNPLGIPFVDSKGVVVSSIKNAWEVAKQIHNAGGCIVYKKQLTE